MDFGKRSSRVVLLETHMFALQRGNRFTDYTLSECQIESLQPAGLVIPNMFPHPYCARTPFFRNLITTTAHPKEYAASTVNQPASQDGFEPTFFFVTWLATSAGAVVPEVLKSIVFSWWLHILKPIWTGYSQIFVLGFLGGIRNSVLGCTCFEQICFCIFVGWWKIQRIARGSVFEYHCKLEIGKNIQMK